MLGTLLEEALTIERHNIPAEYGKLRLG